MSRNSAPDGCRELTSLCGVDPQLEAEIAAFARALAHPARIRILRLLSQHEGCVGGDIVGALQLAQSTVSEHLRILKEAGLITGQISHPRVCYYLDRQALTRLKHLVSAL